MVYDELIQFFGQQNFAQTNVSGPYYTIVVNRVDGEMIFCVLLHSTQSRVMLESTVLNFNSQMLSHASEDNILFLLVTDDIERDKHFVRLPNINLWMIEEEERQLQIYDEMPDDFYGMRYGIEKTLIAGKTNAWGTVGTTTRATSSRGTTSASTKVRLSTLRSPTSLS